MQIGLCFRRPDRHKEYVARRCVAMLQGGLFLPPAADQGHSNAVAVDKRCGARGRALAPTPDRYRSTMPQCWVLADDPRLVVARWCPARKSERVARATPSQHFEIFEKFGAGEGIRTLDPNLGKVVLYP